MPEVHGDRTFSQVHHQLLANGEQGVVRVGLNVADVRTKNLFLDFLDLEANFLTVRGVEHEALERGPVEEGRTVPLLRQGPERIDEAAEDVAPVDVSFLRLLEDRDLIEGPDADLTENIVDLLERLGGTIHRHGHIAVAAAVELVLFGAGGSVALGCLRPDRRQVRLLFGLPHGRSISVRRIVSLVRCDLLAGDRILDGRRNALFVSQI